MLLGLRTVVVPAPALAETKAWYAAAVGHPPYFDEPFYVGFNVGGYELGLDPDLAPHTGAGGPTAYWGVSNLADEVARLTGLGATVRTPLRDVGGGILVATLLDPFGNPLGLIENPHFKVEPT
jgi:predicted enzyme related to lactoylglutathione lyase